MTDATPATPRYSSGPQGAVGSVGTPDDKDVKLIALLMDGRDPGVLGCKRAGKLLTQAQADNATVLLQRDALAAAMPSDGADAALAYAAMQTACDERNKLLQRWLQFAHLAKRMQGTTVAALDALCRETNAMLKKP